MPLEVLYRPVGSKEKPKTLISRKRPADSILLETSPPWGEEPPFPLRIDSIDPERSLIGSRDGIAGIIKGRVYIKTTAGYKDVHQIEMYVPTEDTDEGAKFVFGPIPAGRITHKKVDGPRIKTPDCSARVTAETIVINSTFNLIVKPWR